MHQKSCWQGEVIDRSARYRTAAIRAELKRRIKTEQYQTPTNNTAREVEALTKIRKQRSAENALALTKTEAEHLNHVGIWALIDAGVISVDRAKTITSMQAEILDKLEILDLLGIQISHLPEFISPYQYGVRANISKPLQATFSESSARITLEQALALTLEQVVILADERLNGLIAHNFAKDNPNGITVERLLALPPEKIAVLQAKGVTEYIGKRFLTTEEALKLTPEQGEKVFGNPNVIELMAYSGEWQKFSLKLEQAIALTPGEIEAISDSGIRNLIKSAKFTIYEAATYSGEQRDVIAAAQNAIASNRISPADASKLPKETAEVIGSVVVSGLMQKDVISLERAKQLQRDDVKALGWPVGKFVEEGLLTFDAALKAGRNESVRQLLENDLVRATIKKGLTENGNARIVSQLAELSASSLGTLIAAVSDDKFNVSEDKFTAELQQELADLILVHVSGQSGAVARLKNPPRIDRPGVSERQGGGFNRGDE